MDIGSIFLILGLLVLVALFIIRPLFEHSATAVSQEEHEYSALLAERDRLLDALQELDFDYTLGKIPEEDYPAQRAGLLQRGAEVLRRLDAYEAEASPDTGLANAEARMEAAIAARRLDALKSTSSIPSDQGDGDGRAGVKVFRPVAMADLDDDLETLLANRRRARSEKSAGFCSQCGGPVQKSDRFCPKCGAKVVDT
jgi:hypothetical protein